VSWFAERSAATTTDGLGATQDRGCSGLRPAQTTAPTNHATRILFFFFSVILFLFEIYLCRFFFCFFFFPDARLARKM